MAVEKYLARLSGPLLDRIDLHCEIPTVPYSELSKLTDGTGSKVMRDQVAAARSIQAERFKNRASALNGRMTVRELRSHAQPDAEGRGLLQSAMSDLGLSARAHDRILRVARTIADLSAEANIQAEHVAEAIGYRTLDRKVFDR
jgi:magnesium chelatase family protein